MPQMVEIPSPSEGRPIPPKFELRPLTTLSRVDLQEASKMLADAFDEHPLFRLAFPKAASRSKILTDIIHHRPQGRYSIRSGGGCVQP